MARLFRSEITRLMIVGFVIGSALVGASHGVTLVEAAQAAESSR